MQPMEDSAEPPTPSLSRIVTRLDRFRDWLTRPSISLDSYLRLVGLITVSLFLFAYLVTVVRQ